MARKKCGVGDREVSIKRDLRHYRRLCLGPDVNKSTVKINK